MPPDIPPTLGQLSWRIARSCDGGNCVQVAPRGDMVVIGDTKNPDSAPLTYTRSEWQAFVEGVRRGDFDDLI
jgi:predicted secreted Zn-dependent protease